MYFCSISIEIQILFSIFSDNESHFINFTNQNNGHYLSYLCRQFYGRPSYSNLIAPINHDSVSAFPKLKKELVTVVEYDKFKMIEYNFKAWAYSCPLYGVPEGNTTDKFKIVPGPRHDSVILIQKIKHTYFVREVIINLHFNFLHYLI